RPEVREVVRRAWGIPVVDLYSASDVGYVALQCPQSEKLHIQVESLLVEALDDNDAPRAPGEVGRVVVTNLHNFSIPRLHDAIGALAEAGAPCTCGRSLPTLERVLGRSRGIVSLPNGQKIFPSYYHLLQGFDQVSQFQIVRTGVEELEMKLVV